MDTPYWTLVSEVLQKKGIDFKEATNDEVRTAIRELDEEANRKLAEADALSGQIDALSRQIDAPSEQISALQARQIALRTEAEAAKKQSVKKSQAADDSQ